MMIVLYLAVACDEFELSFRLRQTALTGLPLGGKSFDVGTNLLLNPLKWLKTQPIGEALG